MRQSFPKAADSLKPIGRAPAPASVRRQWSQADSVISPEYALAPNRVSIMHSIDFHFFFILGTPHTSRSYDHIRQARLPRAMLGSRTSRAIDFVTAISNADLYQALERVTVCPASNHGLDSQNRRPPRHKNILLLRPRISYSPVSRKTPGPTPEHMFPRKKCKMNGPAPLSFDYLVGDCMVTHVSKLIDVSRFRLARQWQTPSNYHFCSEDRSIIVGNALREVTLEGITHSLPMKFLVQNKMHALVYAKIATLLFRVAHMRAANRISSSWDHWKKLECISRTKSKTCAANKIRAFVLLVLRRVAMNARLLLVQLVNRQTEITAVKDSPRQMKWHYARISRAFQRYNMLKKVAADDLREQATKGLQELVRRRQDGGNMKLYHFHIGAFAAGSIQRLQRGNVSRVLARQSKHRYNQQLILARYCSTNGSTDYNFEQQGAAHKIQCWFLLQPSRTRIAYVRNLQIKVSRIQSAVRWRRLGKYVNARVRLRRQLRIKENPKMWFAAIKITTFLRRVRINTSNKRTTTNMKATTHCNYRLQQKQNIIRHDLLRAIHKHSRSPKQIEYQFIHIQSLQRGHLARKLPCVSRIQHV